MSAILAWHFVGATLRDGRPVPPDGEWLVHDGPVKMCESGLHASRDPFDALPYAPGNVLCRVECDDIIDERSDKLLCRRRRILRRIDAEPLLRAYARWCALQVIHLWDAPPIVREYLETGDDSKLTGVRDASAAAMAVTDSAAAAAAAAATAATSTAAAWGAAWAATENAAAMAAASTASTTARDEFNRRVMEAFA